MILMALLSPLGLLALLLSMERVERWTIGSDRADDATYVDGPAATESAAAPR
jgi:hypothetical protein